MQFWLGAVAVEATLGVGSAGGHGASCRSVLSQSGGPSWAVLQESSGGVGGMVIAGVALIALGLAVVAVWRSDLSSVFAVGRRTDGDAGTATEQDTESGPGAETESASSPTAPGGVQSRSEQAELTDQEVIIDILDDHEGRMKQAKIVDETGWSKSKVSMLLSDMDEDGEISKLRVGRENIVSLSGNEPEAAGSPFEDE
jgi:hypothetical protein